MRQISFKNCPYCGCNKIYASASANPWQKLAALFFLRLVRCHVCMRRHYRPIFVSVAENPARNNARRRAAEVLSIKKNQDKKRTA